MKTSTLQRFLPGAGLARAPMHPLAGVAAGVIAGAVYLAAQMLLVGGPPHEPWMALRRICAILLGEDVLSDSSFGANQAGIGLLVHFGISVVYGRVIDLVVRDAPLPRATALGALVGLGLYVVAFEIVAQLAFPWFRASPDLITVADHILFGAVAGSAYCVLRRHWTARAA